MINNVFRFDRRLSALLLKNITHVEEELRNLTAYFFDLNNRIHTERWCDIEGYDPKIDVNKISKLIEAINLEIQTAKESNNPYIKHYIQKESQIPTWIMIKVIKMTTFTKFIEYLKREVKRQLCDFYQIEHNESVNDFKILFSALNWIRKSRNACAHNERIIFLSDDNPAVITKYHHLLSNAYRQRNRSKQVVDLLIFLKYFNIRNDYKKLIRTILTELNQIKQVIESEVFEKIRVGLGIRHIQHMDIIVNDPKEIDYISLI
jgi:abortive infection bacteriophage resistance protein